MPLTALQKGKGRAVEPMSSPVHKPSSRTAASSEDELSSDSGSDSSDDSSEDSESEDEITEDFINSFLDKAKQNAIARQREKQTEVVQLQDEEDVIHLEREKEEPYVPEHSCNFSQMLKKP